MFKRFLCASLIALSMAGCVQKETVSSAMRIETMGGVGSGVKISEDQILTASHVVYGKADIYVINEQGDKVDGWISFIDREHDIAVVTAQIKGQIANVSCKEKQIGTRYETIGNPLGFKFVHSWGRIAGTPRQHYIWKSVYIADGAAIHGSSGGGAFATNGDLIGLVVGIATSNMPMPSASGYSFIVPMPEICKVLKIDD